MNEADARHFADAPGAGSARSEGNEVDDGAASRVLAFVLAGGEGSRLRPLTLERPKPALPFVDGYRIVDFVLSNLLNSGVTSVYVIAQYKPRSLIAHVEGAWRGRFAAAGGFVRTVLPAEDRRAVFRGTADAVACNLDLVREHRPDVVAVFAADHVYRMDVREMIAFHVGRQAEVSVAATRVPLVQAFSFGVIVTDDRQRIVGFEEKPERPTPMHGDPAHAYASMGNYLFEPDTLERLLECCAREGGSDFGHHVMPLLPNRARAYAYDFSTHRVPGLQAWEAPSYWRDVGTPEALEAACRDAAGPRPRLDLANPAWPIHKERRGRERSARGSIRSEAEAASLSRGLAVHGP